MRMAVLLNQGALKHPQFPGAEVLLQSLAALGFSASLQIFPGSQLAAATRAAIAHPVEAVLAGGGDGTISAVAAALADTDIALGILPLGTLNHFAKDLGLPLDWQEALTVVGRREIRRVDLGEVNGRIFVNNSAIGFYPLAVRERLSRQQSLGKPLAMVLAIFRLLRDLPRIRLTVKVGASGLSRRTSIFFVGNNRYLASGPFWSRPALDGGELWLVLAPPLSRLRLAALALRGLAGRLDMQSHLDSLCTSEIKVDSRRSHLHVANDGEVLHLAPPLLYRSRPGALRVFAPQETS